MPLLELIGIVALTLVVVYLALRKANDDKPFLGVELFESSGQLFENPKYSLAGNAKGIDDPFVNPKYGFGNDPILGEKEWVMNEVHKPTVHQNPPVPYEGFAGRSDPTDAFNRYGKSSPNGSSPNGSSFKAYRNKKKHQKAVNVFGDKPCKCDKNFR